VRSIYVTVGSRKNPCLCPAYWELQPRPPERQALRLSPAAPQTHRFAPSPACAAKPP
jgi:hypothetical protein